MNNYQVQQMWNDVIGFSMFVIMAAFMVGMVRPMGKFFEPSYKPEKHLPEPVVKEVTVPGGSYWKCSTCGKELPPGTKVFKAGREVYCSIPCIKLPEHHSNVTLPKPIRYGTCYEDAWRFLIREEEGYLVHGSVQLSAEAPRVKHAWVELPTGYVWEPQTGNYYTVEGFKIMSPIEEHRYTVEEAAILLARVGKHGPWTDEERAKWAEAGMVTGYRSGVLRPTKGMMASEGEGLYVAKTEKLASFFIEPGIGVKEVKFKAPKNPLIAKGQFFSLSGSEDILEPISDVDTEWERFQKQAARNTDITLDDWLEDPENKLPNLNTELTRLMREAGYDAVDAGEWYVLLDETLWKNIPKTSRKAL